MIHYFSYQNGPDTYLLQLRDVDFPVRLREYMKVAANRGPGRSLIVSDDNGYDWRVSILIKLLLNIAQIKHSSKIVYFKFSLPLFDY